MRNISILLEKKEKKKNIAVKIKHNKLFFCYHLKLRTHFIITKIIDRHLIFHLGYESHNSLLSHQFVICINICKTMFMREDGYVMATLT